MNRPKQVIVWRKDLKCRLGKKMAQAAHASMKVLLGDVMYGYEGYQHIQMTHEPESEIAEGQPYLCTPLTPEMVTWIEGKFTKIVLQCPDEETLLDYTSRQEPLTSPTPLSPMPA